MKIKKNVSKALAFETYKQHNVLDGIVRNQFTQVAGQMQAVSQNFQQLLDRIVALEKDAKLLSFYVARGREENAALRILIQNSLTMDKFQGIFDQLLRRDFLVDSNNVPVGNVSVNQYN